MPVPHVTQPGLTQPAPTCVPAALAHFQIHLEAVSTASAGLDSSPLHNSCDAKKGVGLALGAGSEASTSHLYGLTASLCSLTSSIWSFKGTVSPSKKTCLEEANASTRSGLKEVSVMLSRNLGRLPKSTCSSQSDESRLANGVGCCYVFSSALTMGIIFWLWTCWPLH